MKKRSWLFGILLSLMVLGGLTYRYVFRAVPEDLSTEKVAFRLEAADLFEAFQNNEVAANQKYGGQIVQISGPLLSAEQDQWGQTTLVFVDQFAGVTATLDSLGSSRQQNLIRNLTPGAPVRLLGRCDGFLMDVKLSKCFLLDH